MAMDTGDGLFPPSSVQNDAGMQKTISRRLGGAGKLANELAQGCGQTGALPSVRISGTRMGI